MFGNPTVLQRSRMSASGFPESLCRDLANLTREGDAATEIIRTAQEIGVDLIVLGASHKRFFDATVLGSTTVRVTRHASFPVLVAFAAAGQESGQTAFVGTANERN